MCLQVAINDTRSRSAGVSTLANEITVRMSEIRGVSKSGTLGQKLEETASVQSAEGLYVFFYSKR